jgi:NNP family nitrate/nitrite transporter-like MFS transporter
MSDYLLKKWEPEDPAFWKTRGSAIANRNLWISIPALMLAFAVWSLWSVVVVNLDKGGFHFTKNELFWLTALPALSGATLRIFYSFLVPIFGGRRFTAFSTATLLIPAIGMGFALRDPSTGYTTLLVLALLCGLAARTSVHRWRISASSFPKQRKDSPRD